MVNKVVATKLTDEEHSRLLDACNEEGCTPSALIKKAIISVIETEEVEEKPKNPKQMSLAELAEALGKK